MKLWTDARLLDFLSRLSQPSTSSAVPLPSPLLQLLESQIHPVLTDCFTCWWGSLACLLGLIFLPRSAAASGDELRDLSAEGAGPIPILCPASVSPRFFACFLVAYFDEFVFFFFSGCLGRRSWNRRRSGMCCDVSAQILVFRIPRHLSIFVKRGLLLPQQIALYWHDTETLMYCIHSHASNVLYSFTCFFVVMVPIFWNRVISCCIEIMMMVN